MGIIKYVWHCSIPEIGFEVFPEMIATYIMYNSCHSPKVYNQYMQTPYLIEVKPLCVDILGTYTFCSTIL